MLSTGGDCKKYIDGDDNNDKNIYGVTMTKEFSVTVTVTKKFFYGDGDGDENFCSR